MERKWLGGLNKDNNFKFVSEGRVRCLVCEAEIVVSQKSQLKQHLRTKGHLKNVGLKAERKALQEGGKAGSSRKSDNGLARDLCKMAVAVNLSWAKFDHPVVKEILERHIGKSIPGSGTIEKQLSDLSSQTELEIEVEKQLDFCYEGENDE